MRLPHNGTSEARFGRGIGLFKQTDVRSHVFLEERAFKYVTVPYRTLLYPSVPGHWLME